MDTHLTNSLLGSPGMWNDTINVYHGADMLDATPAWSMTHERIGFDDTGKVRVVVSDEYFSFTNQGYIWYADAETGELQDSYACHRYVEDGDGNSNELLPVGTYFYVVQFASGKEPNISWIYLNY
jgi:hypothetical protein